MEHRSVAQSKKAVLTLSRYCILAFRASLMWHNWKEQSKCLTMSCEYSQVISECYITVACINMVHVRLCSHGIIWLRGLYKMTIILCSITKKADGFQVIVQMNSI